MTNSKSKQPEDQQKTSAQPENPAKPEVPTRKSSWRLPAGITEVEDGESHIFVGGLPCGPPLKPK